MNRVIFWGSVVIVALVLILLVMMGYGAAWLLSYLPRWSQVVTVITTVLLVSYILVKYGPGKED
ncbi:hypothetical protein V8K88_000066 [Listeria monocytogenes]|uniref:hypothetical protein n=1 Tax=Listeria monocytogenes TaxID=1639 RepID=UPI000985CD1C|nr:hypothetical protein [Listeria monocytogenes]EAD4381135.1 hypothetical protein [Listeria monocytogenes]EAD4384199.1 hypothetical protein [Listeria monocytogenes]EAD4387253.1 hypothetical protein [Listeria monocytogenes]EAE4958913.1 hypothetical protein [Listeria monocytogenes]EAE9969977.1 hypothetical protein [Listeria monocytogenes]